jgi:uncharacterized protein involved in exopolysaccharide biosynthesis
MEEDTKGLGDYLEVVRRRRWQLVLPAAAILLTAVASAWLIPLVYRSSATILIEQQEIPQDLVRSTVTSYADQRVRMISQRVMTTAKLGEIIERLDLYARERSAYGLATAVDKMRVDVALDMVSADVVDPRSGRPVPATIAFTLGYDSSSPAVAQAVVQEIVSLFLAENLKTRRDAARETAKFLGGEADKLAEQISSLEIRLATFKEEHATSLPELMQLNLQMMERIESQLRDNEQAVRAREERRIYLRSELAQISPYSKLYSSTGERILSASDRLKALEAEYVGLAASYSASHPDRIKTEREIAALRREVGATDTADLQRRLADQQGQLATLKDRYSDTHPDVRKARATVEATERRIAQAHKGGKSATGKDFDADNPAYIQLQAQLQAAEAELGALHAERQQLTEKLTEMEARIAQAPVIERDYRALTRDYDNAIAKYREIRTKQMQAELGQSLEAESKGERFALVEPPQLPEKPSKPNRLAILLIGFVFSIAGGVGNVLLQENLDRSVRGVPGIAAVLGAPPLGVIPYIVTAVDLSARRRYRRRLLAAASAMLVLSLTFVHFVIAPLDAVWISVLERVVLAAGGQAE